MIQISISKNLSTFLLPSLLFFITCKDKGNSENINDNYLPYISAFSSGLLSRQSTIQVVLTENLGLDKDRSTPIDNLFDFSPKIKGQAYWMDNQTIEFVPETSLPSGIKHKASFHLQKINPDVPSNLKAFKFEFATPAQSMQVNIEGMKAYTNGQLNWQQVKGYVLTADYAASKNVERCINAIQNNQTKSIRWEHQDNGQTHIFTIDSIMRTQHAQTVDIKWNGNVLGIKSKGKEIVDIPALEDFKILNLKVVESPGQHISVLFSDPLTPTQNLNGLIHLDSKDEVRFIVEQNQLKIYPIKRLAKKTSLIIEAGVQSIGGYKLGKRNTTEISFLSIKPALKLLGDGNIVPSSTQGLSLPFQAVNISAVNVRIVKIFQENVPQFLQANHLSENREIKRVGRIVYKGAIELQSEKNIDFSQWNTFSLDLSRFINTEPGAIYRVQLGFDQAHSLYPCPNDDNGTPLQTLSNNTTQENESDTRYWQYNGYDYQKYDPRYDYWKRKDPCHISYYLRNNNTTSRNVLASDLGIIAKGNSNQSMLFAITDLKTTQALSGVKCEVYNFQHQKIQTVTTDAEGIARLRRLDSKPFLLIAKQAKQRGYLRLDDGSSLSLSTFEVDGKKSKKGIKGMIYGERGVWRPGDTLFLSFILEDKLDVLPDNHPVVFELKNPRGQLHTRTVRTSSAKGLYGFTSFTEPSAYTGNWTATVRIGGNTFRKNIKIETIKPNRLKATLDFGKEMLTAEDKTVNAQLNVKWIHGAKAKNLRAKINLVLSSKTTTFKDYERYTFNDPSVNFQSEEREIFSANVNRNGNATIPIDLQMSKSASGMLNAFFKIHSYEKGGDFSTNITSISYSPYKSYVGLNVPKGEGSKDALMCGKKHTIPIVTIDQNGKPTSRKNIKIQVYKLNWRWWWENRSQNNLARYLNSTSSELIETKIINSTNGRASYTLELKEPYYGRVFIRVTDMESKHSAGQIFYMDYPYWDEKKIVNKGQGASMLTFKTDKQKYNIDDVVSITIPTGVQGKVLVSLETGSKVISTYWMDTKEESTTFQFQATKDMSPNVYAHITLIQPHNQTVNDLPIRLYGVQSIAVEDENTKLQPIIDMPEELAPEKNVQIKIKEQMGKAMSYTISVVDEGLLDITNFKTPTPWSHFYAKDALGVKTWDTYDDVIGAYSGEMVGLLAVGGGDELAESLHQSKANRFKPIVKFFGPFELKKGVTAKHNFIMPNYIGSVRTMVVAAQNGAYGAAEKTTPVKKPLMIIATMPRVVGPGEKLKLPISVFAMDKSIKNVQVSIEANEFFNLEAQSKTIHFDEEGDKMIQFDLSTIENLGIGKINITAQSGKHKASYPIEISVRPPNPMVSKTTSKVLQANQKSVIPYTPIGMQGTNSGTLEVSTIPPLNIQKRLQYLVRYPHGCIEQTTSSVFTQLHLDKLLTLDNETKQKIDRNIIAGIKRIKAFQLSNGGLSYWPSSTHGASDWGTSYAGHFMLEAKAKGYDLPINFFKNWIKYQTKAAQDWWDNKRYSRSDLAQAYRLYTLALAGKPVLSAMNRLRENPQLSLQAKWRLAAAYFLAGKGEIGEKMISNLAKKVPDYKEMSYSYGSALRDEAMILETLIMLGKTNDAQSVLKNISENMRSDRWYSTQTTAYTLLAASKFMGENKPNGLLQYESIVNGKQTSISTTDIIKQQKINISSRSNGKIEIENKGQGPLFIQMMLEGIPMVGDVTNSENNLRMSVNYTDMQGENIDPSKIEQGTDFMATVKISHPGSRSPYKEMALTQIFPSGWEIINNRIDNSQIKQKGSTPSYQDIRDDRVYTYFDVNREETKTFIVLLNAAYLGTYYLPTVYCEAMYDNEINARRAGQWVKVVQTGQ